MPAKLVGSVGYPGGKRFEVAVGDLLLEGTDAIVNAANGALSHGGGVAAAISRAAGPRMRAECERLVEARGVIPVGQAVVTTAGELPFKGVVHAVGPRQGEGDEEGKLVRALTSAFLLAQQKGWSSISFPGVSSGIFAVPQGTCARAYLGAVRKFWARQPDSTLRLIRLVLFEGPLLQEVLSLIAKEEHAG